MEKCTIDSCTILLDSLDYVSFEQAILSINLENPNSHLKKELDNNEPRMMRMGSYGKTYLIKTSQHSIEYGIGSMMERDLSEAFVNISNQINELEKKYRPEL